MKDHRYSLFVLLVLSLSTVSQGAIAEVYKWLDERGNVHYGDRPHGQDNAEAIEMELESVKTDVGTERAEKREKLIEVMQEDRKAIEQQRKQRQAENKARKKECRRLRRNLDRLRHAGGVYKKDKGGERNYLSAEKRAKTEARFRRHIKKVCR